MLRVSQTLPIQNYSIIQPCQNSGNAFRHGQNQKIRFHVDGSQIPMCDMTASYLQFFVQAVDTNHKVQLNRSAEQLIHQVRTYVNGQEVESIDEYSHLCAISQDYAETDMDQQSKSVFTHQNGGAGLLSRGRGTVANPLVQGRIKCQVQLKHSGVWGSEYDFPFTAFDNGVDLELELEDPARCLTAQMPVVDIPCDPVRLDGAGATASVFVTPDRLHPDRLTTNGAEYVEKLAEPPYPKWTDLDDFPLMVGDSVEVSYRLNTGAQVDYGAAIPITAIAIVGGKVQVSLAIGGLTADASMWDIKLRLSQTALNGDGTGGLTALTSNYEVTDPILVLRKLEVPAQQLQILAQRSVQGSLQFDLSTWTCYKHSAPAMETSTVPIPCRATRGKAIILQPKVDGGTVYMGKEKVYPFDWGGGFGTRSGHRGGALATAGQVGNVLRNYQFQFGQTRRPNIPVDLRNTALPQRYPAQEGLTELDKALKVSMGTSRLTKFRENFLIGRSTSAYGSSEDYSPAEILCYFNYFSTEPGGGLIAPQQPIQWLIWCYHVRRIQGAQGGVEVYY